MPRRTMSIKHATYKLQTELNLTSVVHRAILDSVLEAVKAYYFQAGVMEGMNKQKENGQV